jgi:aminoglycoside phosphotransferase (APT) family kinase protein
MDDSNRSLEDVSEGLLNYLNTQGYKNAAYVEPLTQIIGGYDAFTYRFHLSGVSEKLAEPLILRLYGPERNPQTVILESAVQNALFAQDYPAPPVFFTCTETRFLDGAFMIMAFLDGDMMMSGELGGIPAMLGLAHASLHNKDVTALSIQLTDQGIDEKHFRLNGRLDELDTQRKEFPWISDAVGWLADNKPTEPSQLSICHGDFHPMNILVCDDQLTGVLDWPGFMIGDAAMDVAATMILFEVVLDHLMPEAKQDGLLSQYLKTYTDERPLDVSNLDYYRMLRCVPAVIEGATGQGAWSIEPILQDLILTIRNISGIQVVVAP